MDAHKPGVRERPAHNDNDGGNKDEGEASTQQGGWGRGQCTKLTTRMTRMRERPVHNDNDKDDDDR